MTTFLKSLELENYCGFQHIYIDFIDVGQIKNLSLFYGPNGTGKCVPGDTYVIEKGQGQIKISSLFKSFGKLKEDSWHKLPDPIHLSINGNESKVNRIYYAGKKKTIKIKTTLGYNIEGSYDSHKILAVKNGKIEFTYLQNLNKGDFVCLSRKSNFPKHGITTEEAGLLGYMIAEGHCGVRGGQWLFHNCNKEILSNFDDLYKKATGRFPLQQHSNNRRSIHSKTARCWERFGVNKVLSVDKTVPCAVLQSSKESISHFLKTYFEGDGGIDGDSILCWSKSHTLLEQIQLLLLRMGIISSVKYKKQKLNYTDKYPKGYISSSLTISGHNIFQFAEEVGFVSTNKKEKLNNLVCKLIAKKRNPNNDVIPAALIKTLIPFLKSKIDQLPPTGKRSRHFDRDDYKNTDNGLHCMQNNYLNAVKRGIALDKIKSCSGTIGSVSKEDVFELLEYNFSWLKEDYFFDTIDSIKYGETELFDVNVESNHCFWTNGFISHNSTILNAIRALAFPWQYMGREVDLLFRKLTFHKDYDPTYVGFFESKGMKATAIFLVDNVEKEVTIENTKNKVGVKTCELERQDTYDIATPIFYVDADNPINTSKFQINDKYVDKFIDLASAVYDFPCEIPSGDTAEVEETDKETGEKVIFHTNFILHKPNGTRVHYRSMSAGERKIATMLSMLCSPLHLDLHDVFLIDNTSMHIYWKRHEILVEELLKHFNKKQLIVTDHSGILIKYIEEKYPQYAFDLEKMSQQVAI
tara:strand:- start:3486 stop:5735 length:2250 start_codon:yes stop_codon:yes gene_type:complete